MKWLRRILFRQRANKEDARGLDRGDSAPRGGQREDELVFNTRLIEPMLRFFELRYGVERLEALLEKTGASLAELREPDRWLTVRQVRELNWAMVEYSGNHLLTYEAGLGLANPRVIGSALYHLMRATGSVRMALGRLNSFGAQISRITRWEVHHVGENKAVLRFHVAKGHVDDILFCLNRQGTLAAIPLVFDLPAAQIRHPVCLHRGGDCCEYHLQWLQPSWWLLVATLAAIGFNLVVIALVLLQIIPALGVHVAVGLDLLVMGTAIYTLRQRNKMIVSSAQATVMEMKNELEIHQRRDDELTLLGRIDALTRLQLNVEDLVATALRELVQTLNYDRAIFLHVDPESGILGHPQVVGVEPRLLPLIESLSVKLKEPGEDDRFLAGILDNYNGVLVDDIEVWSESISPRNRAFITAIGSRRFLGVPVRGEDDVLGLLLVDQVSPEKLLGQRDLQLSRQLCHLLGLTLANARMMESLQRKSRDLQSSLLLNQKLAFYLPRTVVRQLMEDPEAATRLGGRRLRASVLFADIKDFTPWAESEEPELVVSSLNNYFAEMDQVIQQCRGIIDKRMGDGMMAVFLHGGVSGLDASEEQEAHSLDTGLHPARRALICGLRMQRAIMRLRDRTPGFEKLSVRIGVAYGELVAGNIGSAYKLEYTVIGDVVNVASRIEKACVPGWICVTRETLKLAGRGFQIEQETTLQLKGKLVPVPIAQLSAFDEHTL